MTACPIVFSRDRVPGSKKIGEVTFETEWVPVRTCYRHSAKAIINGVEHVAEDLSANDSIEPVKNELIRALNNVEV
jgi:hypothetical protein